MRILSFYILFSVLFFNCCNQKESKNNEVDLVEKDLNSIREEIVICDVNLSDNAKNNIINNPTFILNLSDSCIIEILDYLKVQSKKNKDNYKVLNSIYNQSDGAISEYFLEIMTEIFYSNYKDFSDYLYLNKEKDKLHIVLIEALSMDVSDSDNVTKRRQNILKIINEQSKTESIKNYMLGIEKKIDANMFD